MRIMSEENPFAQAAHYFEVTFHLSQEQVLLIETGLEDMALSQASFEVDKAAKQWCARMVVPYDPTEELAVRLPILQQAHGQIFPSPTIEVLQERDWVSEVQASFKPMHCGRFYVYGSHIEKRPPHSSIPIMMDAGAAFGTGEHETTSGCLEALDGLKKAHQFSRILDMGTGTGILAIAAAKCWQVPVMAVDLDAMAVQVARRNVKLNAVHHVVRCEQSRGYQSSNVSGRYDLIVANILAKPLVKMAKDARRYLQFGGTLVLSGLLTNQENRVMAAHQIQGIQLVSRICKGPWSTLILRG